MLLIGTLSKPRGIMNNSLSAKFWDGKFFFYLFDNHYRPKKYGTYHPTLRRGKKGFPEMPSVTISAVSFGEDTAVDCEGISPPLLSPQESLRRNYKAPSLRYAIYLERRLDLAIPEYFRFRLSATARFYILESAASAGQLLMCTQ